MDTFYQISHSLVCILLPFHIRYTLRFVLIIFIYYTSFFFHVVIMYIRHYNVRTAELSGFNVDNYKSLCAFWLYIIELYTRRTMTFGLLYSKIIGLKSWSVSGSSVSTPVRVMCGEWWLRSSKGPIVSRYTIMHACRLQMWTKLNGPN